MNTDRQKSNIILTLTLLTMLYLAIVILLGIENKIEKYKHLKFI